MCAFLLFACYVRAVNASTPTARIPNSFPASSSDSQRYSPNSRWKWSCSPRSLRTNRLRTPPTTAPPPTTQPPTTQPPGGGGSGGGLTTAGVKAGYWMVGSDGAVYNFGSAPYLGGLAGTPVNRPIVGIAVR